MGLVADAAAVRLDQMDDPATTLRRLARKHDVPRNMRRLAEAHGEVTYVAGDDDAAASARRHAVDARPPLAGRRGARSSSARPSLEAFTRESVAELVAAELGRVDCLTAGGRRLTVSTIFQVDDRQIGDNTVVDPDFSRFGPGHAALAFQLEHGLENGVREVDLRAGDFPHKQRWANATIRTRSLVAHPSGAPGRRPAPGPPGGDERAGPPARPPHRELTRDPRSTGAPHPPPPGVSIRRTSPARSRTVHLSGSRSARASSPPGSSQFSPAAPGPPPCQPGRRRDPALGDERHGHVLEHLRGHARCPRRRAAPRRPRCPAAAGSAGPAAGTARSRASTGVFFVFVIPVWTPLMPPAPGRPPCPPATVS